jgi:hypothetical protein
MSCCLIIHNDLDGFYSGLLLLHSSKYQIDNVIPVEYGNDYSYLKDRYSNFIIADYSNNIGSEKTILWIDHHVRQENCAKKTVIAESPSCVSLIMKENLAQENLISKKVIDYIDTVDSVNFKFDENFRQEDVIFPEYDNELCKYIILNNLLSKNKKTNLVNELLLLNTLDINTFLHYIDNTKDHSVMKYNKYINTKKIFFDKLAKERKNFIKHFSGIPVLFTHNFTRNDWIGYDRNVFAYLMCHCPILIVSYNMNNKISYQVLNNFFYGKTKVSLYDTLKNDFSDLKGHKNILNFTFDDNEKALKNLDLIIQKISETYQAK